MVTEGMRHRYNSAVLMLLYFLNDFQLSVASLDHLDDIASRWIEHLYADGQPKGLASDGLAGLQYFLPSSAGKLKHAWKLTKVWQRIEPPLRVIPLSPALVLGFAGLAAEFQLSSVAAGLLLCFDAMLRSGELYSLLVGDITFYRAKAVASLRSTKTGKRTGASEMVVVESQLAIYWLKVACSNRHANEPLLCGGAASFRKCFKLFIEFFEVKGLVNVYSLRRGGATWDFLSHQSMERTLLRVRWSSNSSARVYVQDAVAMVNHLRLTEQQHAWVRRFARNLRPPTNGFQPER